MKLVIASNNRKKRSEIAAILKNLGIRIMPPDETVFVEVEEDGETFAQNAKKKAESFAKANQYVALGDDSGLCVDALNGAPGVYSSRFAGIDADDAANNAKLLRELDGIANRNAYFICSIHITFPDGRCITVEGRVDGEILERKDGAGGFGYDPLFYCPELEKTFAQASPEEKASVSHRGRALKKLSEELQAIV
ncbi:MAG: XTP/dITP diphosphatase [Zetaproteobacteria bacterium]|nr:MAG: XTP/dITP diphosphatase [Zetaproteobacteria bacterium]